MSMPEIKDTMQLDRYKNSFYQISASIWQQTLWYFFGYPLVHTRWLPLSILKVSILRLFGAKIGKGVTIKPCVKIKYPWHLKIGDYVWIGENTWIDNLVTVTIESNCCISQDVYLCTGNHDWGKTTFDLITGEIYIEEGSWIAARAAVGPGVTIGKGAILSLGSVTGKSLKPMTIYAGNPAEAVKERKIADLDKTLK
jgi:putative colanic acid biosynthesis acetyltransferase WcaF